RQRAQTLSRMFKAPFIYVNRVGGEDEILFDGSSFVVDNDKCLLELRNFESESKCFTLEHTQSEYLPYEHHDEILWESLFAPQLNLEGKLPLIKTWTKEDCELVFKALSFGFQEYAQKSGFKKFLVALS